MFCMPGVQRFVCADRERMSAGKGRFVSTGRVATWFCGCQHSIMRRVERAPDQQGRTVRGLRIPRRKSSKPAAQYSHGALVTRMSPLQFVCECLSARRAADLAQHAVKDNVPFLLGQFGCEIGHARFKIARGHMSGANNVSNGKVILQKCFHTGNAQQGRTQSDRVVTKSQGMPPMGRDEQIVEHAHRERR